MVGGGAGMVYLPAEDGQGLVEYAFIILLIALIVIAVLTLIGPAVGNMYSSIVAGL